MDVACHPASEALTLILKPDTSGVRSGMEKSTRSADTLGWQPSGEYTHDHSSKMNSHEI